LAENTGTRRNRTSSPEVPEIAGTIKDKSGLLHTRRNSFSEILVKSGFKIF